MPAKDIYHDCVKNALIKDGWTITDDPLSLKWGKKDMYVDLGAEQLLAAERAERKIAVEIKSFMGLSEMNDLEKAIGQYIVYHDVLAEVEPDRELYLAVSQEVASGLFEEPIGELLIKNNRVRLLVFDSEAEDILKWTL
ncbi:MAG: fatty-acid synthase [Moorea sp. SIOASIH]|uniref:XisH family protein n=1 Tax=Moorena sp. SIOASIH TaxID=2607817 RepID=UPI0013B8CB0D|nr:XisH family protein [Moorena sp. SIOASIH]NEO38589.1 fatty-acid synthase [Moorena sp. SIOASIH]